MNEGESPFTTGRYHREHKYLLGNKVDRSLHEASLAVAHMDSLRLIKTMEDQGWRNPFEQPEPQILQIGTAGFETSEALINFAKKQNPNTKITVSDISEIPLTAVAHRLDLDGIENVTVKQADTRKLDFPDDAFDMLTTDALLQLLSPEEREKALQEWFRVLKPGGIATTRDWLITKDTGRIAKAMQAKRRHHVRNKFGVQVYPMTEEELAKTATNTGFQVIVDPVTETPWSMDKRLNTIVLHKPNAE